MATGDSDRVENVAIRTSAMLFLIANIVFSACFAFVVGRADTSPGEQAFERPLWLMAVVSFCMWFCLIGMSSQKGNSSRWWTYLVRSIEVLFVGTMCWIAIECPFDDLPVRLLVGWTVCLVLFHYSTRHPVRDQVGAALVCPNCDYDLRENTTGICPECGVVCEKVIEL